MKIFIKSIAIVVLMLVAFVGGRMSAYPGIAARFNEQIAFVQANKTWSTFMFCARCKPIWRKAAAKAPTTE